MSYESVNKLLADLHAHRVATMKPEDLAVNINQRAWLVEHANSTPCSRKARWRWFSSASPAAPPAT